MINLYKIKENIKEVGIKDISEKSGISKNQLYLILKDKTSPTVETLNKILPFLDYGFSLTRKTIDNSPKNSIRDITNLVSVDGNWKIHYFNFLDEFLRTKNIMLIESPPVESLDKKYKSLISSIVEYLCDEFKIDKPDWVFENYRLERPWFPIAEESEYMKSIQKEESPNQFKRNNIFVSKNFLLRACN